MLVSQQQRWISNAMYLVDMLNAEDKFVKEKVEGEEEGLLKRYNAKIREIINIINYNDVLDVLEKTKDEELCSFYMACKKDGDNKKIDNEAGGKVNKRIHLEVNCMSPYARKIASKLIHEYDKTGKKKYEAEGYKIEDTLLFAIFKLTYLNRIICALAEEVAKERSDIKVTVKNGLIRKVNAKEEVAFTALEKIISIYVYAQRIRCCSFGDRYQLVDNDPTVEKEFTLKELKEKFEKEQKEKDCPFNKDWHRRREKGSRMGAIINDEAYLLSIGSGRSITNIQSDSTLGLVQRVLGLPERCDISGTTTDAIGAALALYGDQKFDDSEQTILKPSFRQDYILACIISMCLSGHHSLSEMGAAISLWSSKNYNPLDPESVISCLDTFYNRDGKTPDNSTFVKRNVDGDEHIISNSAKSIWLSLVGSKYEKEEYKDLWEFNDKNWYVWKAFAEATKSK